MLVESRFGYNRIGKRFYRYLHTKTETALRDGLDATAEEIGAVDRPYHNASTYINVRETEPVATSSLGYEYPRLGLFAIHSNPVG